MKNTIKHCVLLFTFLFLNQGNAESLNNTKHKQTICLNMVVKNEKESIEKCLPSLISIIDSWVIIDRGSTDGTQDSISRILQDIPGRLYESSSQSNITCKNKALKASQGMADYLLLANPGDYFHLPTHFSLSELNVDIYLFTKILPNSAHLSSPTLVKNSLNWQWVENGSESIQSQEAKNSAKLHGFFISSTKNYEKGYYLNKAASLQKKDLENGSILFYLAQNYEDAGEMRQALKYYAKRASINSSNEEESFHAIYRMGKILHKLQNDEEALKALFKAHRLRPFRAEPLFEIAKIYRKTDNPLLGYLVSKYALSIPYPVHELYIEPFPYNAGLLMEFTNNSFLLGKNHEALKGCEILLNNLSLTQESQEQILAIKRHAKKSITGYDALEVLELVAQFIPENPVILEAGAHYGEDTRTLSHFWPKGTIHAFEPNPEAFLKLEQQVASLPNTYCYSTALYDHEGTVDFYINRAGGNDGASSLLKASELGKNYYQDELVQVPCTTLEKWQASHANLIVDFMWLDLEGTEIQMLEHGIPLLSTCTALFIEVNHLEFRKGMTQYEALKSFLSQAGFEEVKYWPVPNIQQGNSLFVKSTCLKNK